MLDDYVDISRTKFPTNSTFLLVPQEEEAGPHSGYLWNCTECSAESNRVGGWINKRGIIRAHSTECRENHCLFPFSETAVSVRELKSLDGNSRGIGISGRWGRCDLVASLSSLQIGVEETVGIRSVQDCGEAAEGREVTTCALGSARDVMQKDVPTIDNYRNGVEAGQYQDSLSTNDKFPDNNMNVGTSHAGEESHYKTRKRRINYSKMCEDEDRDISEDSGSDISYDPKEKDSSAEDLKEEEPPIKVRRVSGRKDRRRIGIKPLKDTDEDDSDTEEKNSRRERKTFRRVRMEEELKLGEGMTKEWEFHKDDDEVLTKYRKEVWLNSEKSQQMDGSESGLTRIILVKLNAGIKLTPQETQTGVGVATIENYVNGLRKDMNSYNKQRKEKFPGGSDIRLADFFLFKSVKQILPQSPEFLIQYESSLGIQCNMIQSHTAFLKLINKELQGGTTFSCFLPRDPSNPGLPKQDYTSEEFEKAMESKDRFSLSIRAIIKSSADLLSKTKKRSDSRTKRLKQDREMFQGKLLPNPQEVILKFFESQYAR